MVESEEEQEFLTVLYTENKQRMYNIAFKLLGNKSDAEDAVSEAFLKIIGKINKISKITADERAFYIVIIVKNTALDMLRKRSRMNEVSIDDFYDIRDERSSFEQTMSNVGCDEIKDCLMQLEENDYEALYLKLFMECTNREIAELLNIGQGAARQRVSIARRRLIKLLRERGFCDV